MLTKMQKQMARLFLLSWLALMPATTWAQFHCKITIPEVEADTQFIVTSVSCAGNNCTASILADKVQSYDVKILFQRSNDGGRTWAIQDPGLPNQIVAYRNRITKVEQIDSLNIVAIGDTMLALRTFDGGITWHQQTLPTTIVDLEDVSFANPNEGIIVAADFAPSIFTTSDGGEHWNAVSFWQPSLWQCHAYGNGRFRVFKYDLGETYYTSDNWKTVDSTKGAIDRSDSAILSDCNFGSGDTIIEFGAVFVNSPGFPTRDYPIIVRSTDAGQSWKVVFKDTDTSVVLGYVRTMSPLDRDTIFAGLSLGRTRVLFSTDRGETWSIDTLLFDTAVDYIGMYSVAMNASGQFVGAMGLANDALVLGDRAVSSVQSFEHLAYYSYLYPNPATHSVNVVSEDRNHPLHVYDILGREVLRSQLGENGKCKLDVSMLPAGMYVVMLEHDGSFLPVSRVAIIGD